jgi:hypothetical protein
MKLTAYIVIALLIALYLLLLADGPNILEIINRF